MDKDEILETMVDFLSERFELVFDDEDLDYDTDLFEFGYVDSLESLVIVNFIEKKFKISVSPDDLIENPINSVNEMADFIHKKGN